MAIVEGYSEHVMDASATGSTPPTRELRSGSRSAPRARGPLDALVSPPARDGHEAAPVPARQGVLRRGRRAAGIETLNLVWRLPRRCPRAPSSSAQPAGSPASPRALPAGRVTRRAAPEYKQVFDATLSNFLSSNKESKASEMNPEGVAEWPPTRAPAAAPQSRTSTTSSQTRKADQNRSITRVRPPRRPSTFPSAPRSRVADRVNETVKPFASARRPSARSARSATRFSASSTRPSVVAAAPVARSPSAPSASAIASSARSRSGVAASRPRFARTGAGRSVSSGPRVRGSTRRVNHAGLGPLSPGRGGGPGGSARHSAGTEQPLLPRRAQPGPSVISWASASRPALPVRDCRPPCEMDGTPTPTQDQITETLRAVIDPELRRSIVELGMVRSIEIDDDGAGRRRRLADHAGLPDPHPLPAGRRPAGLRARRRDRGRGRLRRPLRRGEGGPPADARPRQRCPRARWPRSRT